LAGVATTAVDANLGSLLLVTGEAGIFLMRGELVYMNKITNRSKCVPMNKITIMLPPEVVERIQAEGGMITVTYDGSYLDKPDDGLKFYVNGYEVPFEK
jgi:hypothetical protein